MDKKNKVFIEAKVSDVQDRKDETGIEVAAKGDPMGILMCLSSLISGLVESGIHIDHVMAAVIKGIEEAIEED